MLFYCFVREWVTETDKHFLPFLHIASDSYLHSQYGGFEMELQVILNKYAYNMGIACLKIAILPIVISCVRWRRAVSSFFDAK